MYIYDLKVSNQTRLRHQSDVDPSYIMKRVNESSGSKYSIHKEAPRPVEKPTPVVR